MNNFVDENLREKSLKVIKKKYANKTTKFQRFVVPTISVNAKVNYEATDLSCPNITEPPLIRHMIMCELENFRSEPLLFYILTATNMLNAI